MSCPSLLFIAVIKCGRKSAWKKRIYFSLQFTVHYEWKSGLGLQAGTVVEAMEECCLLVSSAWFTWLFFYTTQDHRPRAGPSHSGLAPPTSVINRANAPPSCLQASLMETFPQLTFPQLRL